MYQLIFILLVTLLCQNKTYTAQSDRLEMALQIFSREVSQDHYGEQPNHTDREVNNIFTDERQQDEPVHHTIEVSDDDIESLLLSVSPTLDETAEINPVQRLALTTIRNLKSFKRQEYMLKMAIEELNPSELRRLIWNPLVNKSAYKMLMNVIDKPQNSADIMAFREILEVIIDYRCINFSSAFPLLINALAKVKTIESAQCFKITLELLLTSKAQFNYRGRYAKLEIHYTDLAKNTFLHRFILKINELIELNMISTDFEELTLFNELTEFICEYGAPLNCHNNAGCTPLDLARFHNLPSITEILQRRLSLQNRLSKGLS